MNCIIDRLPNTKDHISLIGCIQGEYNPDTALKRCIKDHLDYEW